MVCKITKSQTLEITSQLPYWDGSGIYSELHWDHPLIDDYSSVEAHEDAEVIAEWEAEKRIIFSKTQQNITLDASCRCFECEWDRIE